MDISYKKTWYAHRNAINAVYGDWLTSIAELPKYMKQLQAKNFGTAVAWYHHPQLGSQIITFGYVFWVFALVIEAFRHETYGLC